MAGKTVEAINKGTQPKEGASIAPKQGVAYSQISRILSEKAIKDPDVVRMIINERDNLQIENTELKEWQNNNSGIATENAVLKERFKTNTAFEILSTGTIAIGSTIIGLFANSSNNTYIQS